MIDATTAAHFGAAFAALYVGHHVGDYWVQTDHQARHKGDAGSAGVLACVAHVVSYYWTQTFCLFIMAAITGMHVGWGAAAGLAVSAVTHYMADRREHGLMLWLARRLTYQSAFLELGKPREPQVIETWGPCPSCEGLGAGGPAADECTNGKCWDCRAGGQLPQHTVIRDNPQLATGMWALDQSWHLFWGVFVAALLTAAL